MRRNAFGEACCDSVEEVLMWLDEKDLPLDECHATNIDFDLDKAHADVVENETGETICYIEAPTVVGVRSIIEELRLEVIE